MALTFKIANQLDDFGLGHVWKPPWHNSSAVIMCPRFMKGEASPMEQHLSCKE